MPRITCPECGAKYQAQSQHAGRQFACSHCGHPLQFPLDACADPTPDQVNVRSPNRRRQTQKSTKPADSNKLVIVVLATSTALALLIICGAWLFRGDSQTQTKPDAPPVSKSSPSATTPVAPDKNGAIQPRPQSSQADQSAEPIENKTANKTENKTENSARKQAPAGTSPSLATKRPDELQAAKHSTTAKTRGALQESKEEKSQQSDAVVSITKKFRRISPDLPGLNLSCTVIDVGGYVVGTYPLAGQAMMACMVHDTKAITIVDMLAQKVLSTIEVNKTSDPFAAADDILVRYDSEQDILIVHGLPHGQEIAKIPNRSGMLIQSMVMPAKDKSIIAVTGHTKEKRFLQCLSPESGRPLSNRADLQSRAYLYEHPELNADWTLERMAVLVRPNGLISMVNRSDNTLSVTTAHDLPCKGVGHQCAPLSGDRLAGFGQIFSYGGERLTLAEMFKPQENSSGWRQKGHLYPVYGANEVVSFYREEVQRLNAETGAVIARLGPRPSNPNPERVDGLKECPNNQIVHFDATLNRGYMVPIRYKGLILWDGGIGPAASPIDMRAPLKPVRKQSATKKTAMLLHEPSSWKTGDQGILSLGKEAKSVHLAATKDAIILSLDEQLIKLDAKSLKPIQIHKLQTPASALGAQADTIAIRQKNALTYFNASDLTTTQETTVPDTWIPHDFCMHPTYAMTLACGQNVHEQNPVTCWETAVINEASGTVKVIQGLYGHRIGIDPLGQQMLTHFTGRFFDSAMLYDLYGRRWSLRSRQFVHILCRYRWQGLQPITVEASVTLPTHMSQLSVGRGAQTSILLTDNKFQNQAEQAHLAFRDEYERILTLGSKEDRIRQIVHHPQFPAFFTVEDNKITLWELRGKQPPSILTAGSPYYDFHTAVITRTGHLVCGARHVDLGACLVQFPIPKTVLERYQLTALPAHRQAVKDEQLPKRAIPAKESDSYAFDARMPLPKRTDLNALTASRTKVIAKDELVKAGQHSLVSISNEQGYGSGVIVGSKGYILSSTIAITDPGYNFIHIQGQSTKYQANIIAVDHRQGLALLHCQALAGKLTPVGIPTGDKGLETGEDIHLFGLATLGDNKLSHTLKSGMVSHANRMINKQRYIQLDVGFNHGMSGAPVFDGSGQFAGLAFGKSQGEKIAYAIPIERIVSFLNTSSK